MKKFLGVLLILLALAIASLFVYIATQRELTTLENVLLQIFTLASGTYGSYVLGKESAKEAAKELVKPHARSAFRRLISLYRSLSRLAETIQLSKANGSENNNLVLDKLEYIVIEQIATADDALEDWRDIVPEDVEELRGKLLASQKLGESNG